MKRIVAILVSSLLAQVITCQSTEAQTATAARKPLAIGTIKLPDYLGNYAVLSNGELITLEDKMRTMDEKPSYNLPKDVEFLIYRKDSDPANVHLVLQPPRNGSESYKEASLFSKVPAGSSGIKLLVMPVNNQPQMYRFIPAQQLSDGVYQFGDNNNHLQDWTWYKFCVGVDAQSNGELCHRNLFEIESLKEKMSFFLWGVKSQNVRGTLPVEKEVFQALDVKMTKCPSGGSYSINPFGVDATCTIPDHKLKKGEVLKQLADDEKRAWKTQPLGGIWKCKDLVSIYGTSDSDGMFIFDDGKASISGLAFKYSVVENILTIEKEREFRGTRKDQYRIEIDDKQLRMTPSESKDVTVWTRIRITDSRDNMTKNNDKLEHDVILPRE